MTKIGIIAGSGNLPITVAEACKKDLQVFVAIIENYASPNDFADFNHEVFNIGKIGKILKFFQQNNVTDLLIIGAIKRVSLKSLSVDIKGAALLTKILASKFLGDDQLLKIIADYIESHGFSIKSPLSYLENSIYSTSANPSKQNLQDIEYGKMVLGRLGELDVGQSVIVEEGHVLGIEAAEGTDELILRCGNYRKDENTAVLVKMSKPNQDRRLDLPVIGIDTIINLSKAKMAGVAIEKNSVIILDPQNIVDTADKLGIFIHFI